MCYLLTFAAQGNVLTTPNEQPFCVDEFRNQGDNHKYRETFKVYSATIGGYSYDLVCIKDQSKMLKNNENRLKHKYIKKGWSDRKIERAISYSIIHTANIPPLKDELESYFKNLSIQFW